MTTQNRLLKTGTVPDSDLNQLRENQRAAQARLEVARDEFRVAEAAAQAAALAVQNENRNRRRLSFRRR
jgi:hypothetical protein